MDDENPLTSQSVFADPDELNPDLFGGIVRELDFLSVDEESIGSNGSPFRVGFGANGLQYEKGILPFHFQARLREMILSLFPLSKFYDVIDRALASWTI